MVVIKDIDKKSSQERAYEIAKIKLDDEQLSKLLKEPKKKVLVDKVVNKK